MTINEEIQAAADSFLNELRSWTRSLQKGTLHTNQYKRLQQTFIWMCLLLVVLSLQ